MPPRIAVLNYVGFRALLSLSPLLPHNDGRDLAHLLYVREIPTRTSSKRWKFCIRLLENVYKLPLLQLQAESFEKKDTFQTVSARTTAQTGPNRAVIHMLLQINRTVELLKKYFFRQIRNSSHFGHDTKDIVINKVRASLATLTASRAEQQRETEGKRRTTYFSDESLIE